MARYDALPKSVGEIVEMRSGPPKVRVFGEMVDLLWMSNQPALSARALWSELIESLPLALCAYSTSYVMKFPEALRIRIAHHHFCMLFFSDAIFGQRGQDRYWNRGAEISMVRAARGVDSQLNVDAARPMN